MRKGLGDARFTEAGLTETEHVAVLGNKAAGHEFLDDARIELGARGEVETVEALDLAEVGAFEAALEAALGAGVAFDAQQAQGEVGEGGAVLLGGV